MRSVLLVLTSVVIGGSAAAAALKPNVVFVLADDLGAFDLGCDGRTDHRTPHLDKLAASGARFTNAYAAAAICSPTRAALLTGLSPARLHLTTFLPGRKDAPSQLVLHPKIAPNLPDGTKTVADRFRAAGYATACVGKWHLGGKGHQPTDHGFDVAYPGKTNTVPSDAEGGKGEFDLTAKATAFIEANKDRPFFLYLPHHAPHIPYTAREDLVRKNAAAFEPGYAAVVESLDSAVGKLLAKLDELKMAGNTVVVFSSDNGGVHVPELKHARITHNGPLRAGKGYLYEGGIRVPLLVRWPGHVQPGRVIDTPVISTDWLPTLLELTLGTAPPDLDGVSLAGLLLGGPGPAGRVLFWHQPHYTNQGGRPSSAVRAGDWKLIEFADDGRRELFDLTADPGESKDLSAAEPGRTAELAEKLKAWRAAVGAQENAPNPAADRAAFRALYADFDPSRFAPKSATPAEWAAVAAWRKGMDAAVK